MDKYAEILSQLPVDVLHIAESFAKDNKAPQIEPAHLFRALLHKSVGLVGFIEDTIDSDYYYLLDWADIRVRQVEKSAYPMKSVVFSNEAKSVIREAQSQAEQRGLEEITTQLLLAAVVSPGVGFSADQLKTLPLAPEMIYRTMSDDYCAKPSLPGKPSASEAFSGSEEYFCEAVTAPALPVIGLEDKVRSMLEVLARKDKANLIIVGETGVGKTSLIYGLIQKASAEDAPSSVRDMVLYELDLIALVQGVSYKGEVEDRFKKTLAYIEQQPGAVLVVENIYRLEDKQSVLNGILPILKRALCKNEIQLISTSTIDGYTKDIEKDKELMSYIEKIQLDEPTEQTAKEIVESKMPSYAEFHSIEAEEDIAEELVRLSKRYIPERSLPSSALDLLDRSMASIKIDLEMDACPEQKLCADYVKNVVAKMTGIPMGNLQSEEREKLGNAEEIIHQRLVGQNHAVKSVLDAIYESRSGLNKKGQPIGSFFFLGPTGTGKTELAKSLANFLFNDEASILRFDMSEYKEEHSVALLYGAPPGYVGYEEGGLLVNQIRQHPYSVVLFDEIEKAHKSVFDLFLQILDEGKLHDRLGRVGDFSNALIIFTSNIGSDYIFKSFEENRVPTHDQMLDVMQGQFRPEFLARLTEIVPFSPITPEMIDKIFDIHIKNLLKALKEQNITLEIDDTARKYITKVGFNAHYGARPILGIIRKEIRRPLSKLIISGDINSGDTVTMKYNEVAKEIAWEIDSPDE